ncbi:MAG: hypothetical protein ACOY5C_02730 [Pseudomonadota bacterium]
MNLTQLRSIEPLPAARQEVVCECGFRLFDGEVIRARVVKLGDHGAYAKCRCKRWVGVPVSFKP